MQSESKRSCVPVPRNAANSERRGGNLKTSPATYFHPLSSSSPGPPTPTPLKARDSSSCPFPAPPWEPPIPPPPPSPATPPSAPPRPPAPENRAKSARSTLIRIVAIKPVSSSTVTQLLTIENQWISRCTGFRGRRS
jgi:hypothetical protein